MDLNLRTQRGNTALVHAIWNGNLKARLARSLHARGAAGGVVRAAGARAGRCARCW